MTATEMSSVRVEASWNLRTAFIKRVTISRADLSWTGVTI
jgi:hypothetical protein